MRIRSKVTRLPGSSVLKYYFSFNATQMWLVRFLMRVARPMARGLHRLAVGPSSTVILLMNSLSSSTPLD